MDRVNIQDNANKTIIELNHFVLMLYHNLLLMSSYFIWFESDCNSFPFSYPGAVNAW